MIEQENPKHKKWEKGNLNLTTPRIIALGFLIMILIGACILTTPLASRSGQATPFINALFTSTTASCVTGLVVEVTGQYWSVFGQVIILILIQLGGLGVVSFTTVVLVLTGRRITFKGRLLIQDAYNLETLSGLVKMVGKMCRATFVVEGIGALCYMLVLIPQFGVIRGAWYSIFNAISAFCNAGMDIIGPDSLAPYVNNWWMNIITMLLIILGGIGYLVWWDVIEVFKYWRKEKRGIRHCLSKLSLHTKIVTTITAILIFGGAALIFIIECNNTNAMGNMSLGNKIMACLFQSVTCRTAGFQTIDQAAFRPASQFVCILLMFVGGSPGGTAGGVKTVTVGLLYMAVIATIKGQKDVEIFKRRISFEMVMKGVSVIMIGLTILLGSTIALAIAEEQHQMLDVFFESTSAFATVGLTRGLTTQLGIPGKLIIILTMYLGRIGPITSAMVFRMRKKRPKRQLPEGKILVG